jgi:hypothetical protein
VRTGRYRRRRVVIDVAVQAFGWTRARTLPVLHRLEENLPPVGQRIAWLGDHTVSLAAAPVDEGVAVTVRRSDVGHYGLDATDAMMLHQLITTGVPARNGSWDRKKRSRLVRAGLLDIDEEAAATDTMPIRLSAEARWALALDDAQGTVRPGGASPGDN